MGPKATESRLQRARKITEIGPETAQAEEGIGHGTVERFRNGPSQEEPLVEGVPMQMTESDPDDGSGYQDEKGEPTPEEDIEPLPKGEWTRLSHGLSQPEA